MTKAVTLFWKAAYQKIRRPHLKQRRPSRPRVPTNAVRKAAVSQKELSCPHERGEHDESCGYIPATEGTPCGYICEQCNSQDSGLVPGVSGNAPAECICETRCEQEAVNPDCPVCAAEDADLSACLGKEAALPLMAAAASTEKTISGEVTWNNQTFTTPRQAHRGYHPDLGGR